jgi:IclR family acetate operon transcriptional repressor
LTDGTVADLKSVRDAVRILDLLASTGRSMSVRELAAELALSKSTTQRILSSLKTEQVLTQHAASQRYELGPRLLQFSRSYRRSDRLLVLANAELATLTAATGETSCLYLPVQHGRMAVLQSQSPLPLRWVAEIGQIYPLAVGAAGKVLLAYLPEARVKAEIEARRAEHGPAQAEALARELEAIRERGVAHSTGENLPDVAGAAAVIRSPDGTPVASISAYGPVQRVTTDVLARLEPMLLEAAARLADQVGDADPEPA